jgi:hypothetical protein
MFNSRQAEQIGRLEEQVKSLHRRVRNVERDRERRAEVRVTWLQVLVAGLFVIGAAVAGAVVLVLLS